MSDRLFQNGDSGQRYAIVTVNGKSQTIAFLPGDDGNTPASSSVTVALNSGYVFVLTALALRNCSHELIDRIM